MSLLNVNSSIINFQVLGYDMKMKTLHWTFDREGERAEGRYDPQNE